MILKNVGTCEEDVRDVAIVDGAMIVGNALTVNLLKIEKKKMTNPSEVLSKKNKNIPKIDIDPVSIILAMARATQRKVQGLGNVAKRNYMRESTTYRYISHEVDNVYKAMERLIKEMGR